MTAGMVGMTVLEQYKQRAHTHYQVGMTGACFWLCLVAGLAECDEGVLAQALPGDHTACKCLARVRAIGVPECAAADPRHSDLGGCAEARRANFCSGATAAMIRPDLMARVYPAFAGLDVHGAARTDKLYRQWVCKLARAVGDKM